MARLRVVVNFPEATQTAAQVESLQGLADALRGAMGPEQRLSRLPHLELPGAGGPQPHDPSQPLRVFLLELPDGADCSAALRAIGGWFMQHPTVTLSLRADGPGGGVNLRLEGFSTVGFAGAAARMAEMVAGADAPPTH